MARRFDEALKPLGPTNGQFLLLMSLNRPEPPGMGWVASLLVMDRTTLTAALKPMGRRGLLDIIAHPTGRRSKRIELTLQAKTPLSYSVGTWERTSREAEAPRVYGDPDRPGRNPLALSRAWPEAQAF